MKILAENKEIVDSAFWQLLETLEESFCEFFDGIEETTLEIGDVFYDGFLFEKFFVGMGINLTLQNEKILCEVEKC